MAAVVEIDVSYGSSETVVANVTGIVVGSTDAEPLDTNSYPILKGTNSYEKYTRAHVTSLGGSTSVSNFRVYQSAGTMPTGCTLYYGQTASYTAPVATASTVATALIPTAEPSENLFIGGSSGGSLTAVGYTDYGVFQVQTDGTATAGGSVTITFVYSEVA